MLPSRSARLPPTGRKRFTTSGHKVPAFQLDEFTMSDAPNKTITAVSTPAPGEAGKTGDWRSHTPVIDQKKCVQKDTCLYCWLYCPDGVISREFPLTINEDYCKGCGICAEECPAKAITMEEGRNPKRDEHRE